MKKIYILIILIIFCAGGFWGYKFLKNRYFVSDSKTPVTITNSPEPPKTIEENAGEAGNQENQPTVSPADCDNGCSKFEKDTELEYCKQVCGISAANQAINGTPANCEEKNGLEKDYCLKDLAVKNMDFKICDQINDSGVKKTCQNRISEDIIENQNSL